MKFEVKRAKRGLKRRSQWYARIVAANGRVLFHSETYNNRTDAEDACRMVRAGAADGILSVEPLK